MLRGHLMASLLRPARPISARKNREKKPESEVAIMAGPPLLDCEIFASVQAKLKSRNPLLCACPRHNWPDTSHGYLLLRQVRRCDDTARRTGSAGRTYRSCTCSTKARQSKAAYAGRTTL
ncbi:hypothetical protein BOSEA31B_14851 [Hyphomicrobiales bacterium]|nr:hypothetical protein BOSEA31B_14851 [Hyphomicrobiales bacterium]CAH1701340.1 hypothetical protein BOSEA1005_21039 [Hyphomicrobiales bacterium]CAI0345299.1 hypothetical protein BO1005MUT1_380094 [Hyphomicrobiales bacterium]